MSATATTVQQINGGGQTAGYLKLRGGDEYLKQLDEKGFTVIPAVIAPEKAKEYEDRAYKWLESHGKGFKKDDKETWQPDKMPAFNNGGLFNRHGVHHEQFVWDIRSEPNLIDVFAKVWGTDELLVSYDGINISLPFKNVATATKTGFGAGSPHVDQSPNRTHKHCIQGIVNLAPNGPDDGGLMVLEGSTPLYSEFFEAHIDQRPADGWSWMDGHGFSPEDLKWFEARGCKWRKVEAGPGDVILWDSRTVHYGAPAKGNVPRVATYVCYKPAKNIRPEKLEERKQAFKDYSGTSHDPLEFRLTGTNVSGPLDPDEKQLPKEPAVLSERAKKLVGLVSY
ncbi:hypothetical protein IAR55_003125 [Kwoniella newhampshirensis]|uniref:Phytanoyl-CoA dioxygenase n=1 Tax=Kwoniella newhampshirensis TaxID=1651941 RepID=A0AAW0YPH7_9TREE